MPEKVVPFIEGHTLQVFPQYFGSDGFFIASFRRKVLKMAEIEKSTRKKKTQQ